MVKSLQEQLIAAGLASEKQKSSGGKKRQKPKAKKRDRVQGSAAAKEAKPDPVKINALAKAERDRKLNAKRQKDLARREAVGQIRQLIEGSKLEVKQGEVEYNFADGKMIRKLHLATDMHAQLTAGHLAIAKIDSAYHVVPRVVADKIVERDKSFIVVLNDPNAQAVEDDEYADYKIPDDLMW